MVAAAQFKLSEAWQQRLRNVVLLALLVWLAWALANTFWLLVDGPSEPVSLDRNMTVLQASSGGTVSSGRTVDEINNWELFGPLSSPQQDVAEQAPETRLRLELLGVFENIDSALGSAIIAEQGKDGALYHPGDKMPGNATLKEVYADRVILLRLGQREALRLKEAQLSGGVTETSASTTGRQRLSQQLQSQRARQEKVLESGAKDLVQQRGMIISRLGLRPVDDGGYIIGSGAPEQTLQLVGLRSGDVLLSVNGLQVGNEEADIAALQVFQDTGAASIVVQRGAQRFTVNYPP